jgi:drug/metabolite transporter (DMT)-like permease
VAGFLRSCSSTAGTLAFFVGMENIGATRATMITNLEPIFGVLLAGVVLQERLTIVQAFGIVLVLSAIENSGRSTITANLSFSGMACRDGAAGAGRTSATVA